ncbi:MAG: hypothetical protein ACK5IJ_02030, partial [Mangrovibacterium sp.]
MHSESYFRIVESYRNALGEIRQRSLLTIGFSEELTTDKMEAVGKSLQALIDGEPLLFEEELVGKLARQYYQQLIDNKKIDRSKKTGN